MMHSCINQKHVTVFVICMMICLLGLASCTKKPAPEVTETDTKRTTEPVAKVAAGLVPLPIELPKPDPDIETGRLFDRRDIDEDGSSVDELDVVGGCIFE